MSVQTFFLNAKNAAGLFAILKARDVTKLWRIRIDEYDEKTREQEERYHAMLGDIANQAKHLNERFGKEDWKRLCVKAFADDCIENDVDRLADYWRRNEVRLIPSLRGNALVALGAQTRDFPKYVASGFIEWLYAYGASCTPPIKWSDPTAQDFDKRYAA